MICKLRIKSLRKFFMSYLFNSFKIIAKYTKSKEDQNAKQTRLYEYIIGSEFSMALESMAELNEKMYNLQSKEEKDHQTLWKSRKALHEQLLKAYNDFSSGIESITQDDIIPEKITTKKTSRVKK